MTKKNAYKLMPLKVLVIYPKGKAVCQSLELEILSKDVKSRITKKIDIMFSNSKKSYSVLLTLEKVSKFNKIAKKIFGYDKIIKKIKHNLL